MTEREVLEELLAKVFPEPSRDGWRPAIGYSEEWHAWRHRREAFRKMLDAGAYESAALMLVPKGQDWAVGSTIKGDFFANLDFDKAVHSTTPALALCAAVEAALLGGERGNS